jgi:FAD/FMN-containing dehydrogenase
MTRFNETKYDSYSGTVEVGAGLTWDKVYATLEPSGVSVVGGRTVGVGVAGFALGGGECLPSSESWISYSLGYSFQTDQYGLTLDNIVGYEVVLPNGTATSVTPNDSDLFFALRVSNQA